jgi:predicted DNA-binding transcriptional regulator YafY
MAFTKKPFGRYQILNRHLKRKSGFTIKELTEMVNEELRELEFREDGELTRKYQVSERMIRNDIADIQDYFPVVITKKNGKYYYESTEDSIDNIDLRESDKNTIEWALQVFSRYKGTPWFEKFDDVITRIMSSSVLKKINQKDMRTLVQIGETSENSGMQWIETIYNAISEKSALKLYYKSYGDNMSVRIISPYLLKEYRNKWYMLAYVHDTSKHHKTLLHKLSRIQKIEESGEQYIQDFTFKANDYFQYSIGVFHMHDSTPITVELKIKGKNLIKLTLEDKIHPSMDVLSKSEEEMLIEFMVYDSPELETLILSYGENVEVLAPLELKEKIKTRALKLVELYK